MLKPFTSTAVRAFAAGKLCHGDIFIPFLQKRDVRKSSRQKNENMGDNMHRQSPTMEELYNIDYEQGNPGKHRYYSSRKSYNETEYAPLDERSNEFLNAVQETAQTDPSFGFTVQDEDVDRIFKKSSHASPNISNNADTHGVHAQKSDTAVQGAGSNTVNIFDAPPLGIFTDDSFQPQKPATETSKIWSIFYEEELKRISRPQVKNWFQECINLTNEGKLWKFPIDNEQDQAEGIDVPFEDHVLLERFITDFPEYENVQQFMKIVALGLGKNHYLSAEENTTFKEAVSGFGQCRTFFEPQRLAYRSLSREVEMEGCRTRYEMKHRRHKFIRKYLGFYKNNFNVAPPYKILIDGTFCKAALTDKINISEQMPKYLEGRVELLTTICAIQELEVLGPCVYGALHILRQFNIRRCNHDGVLPTEECFLNLLHHASDTVFIATQSEKLRKSVREIPAVPILLISHNAINLEKPSKFTRNRANYNSLGKCMLRKEEFERLKKMKVAQVSQPKKTNMDRIRVKPRAKGPNPLSCRKPSSNKKKSRRKRLKPLKSSKLPTTDKE